jgi:hypothetical protein
MHPEKQRVSEMLADLDAYLDAHDLDLIRHGDDYYSAEVESDRNDRLYRYGIALREPHGLERYRAKQLEIERARQREREQHQAAEARILRAQQQAAERAARPEMPRGWVDAIGLTIHEERKRERVERAELETRIEALERQQRGAAGEILALPAPVVRNTA